MVKSRDISASTLLGSLILFSRTFINGSLIIDKKIPMTNGAKKGIR